MLIHFNFKNLSFLLFLVFISLGLQSCFKDDCSSTRIYQEYTPVYMSLDEIRQPIEVTGPRELRNTGKLFFSGNYIYINELREGIHIVDNSDPRNPTPVAFVAIPGNVDMAARADRLYVDNYIDLVTLDVSNPRQPSFVGRTEEVFTGYHTEPGRGIIVDYTISEKEVELDCSDPNYDSNFFFGGIDGTFLTAESLINSTNINVDAGISTAALSNLNVGGSLARFTTVDEFLYTVDEFQLRVFSLNNIDLPVMLNVVNVGWGIETIFPSGDELYIGAVDGMYIFDNTNRTVPQQLSKFQHSRACDPVFVDGDIAYVTLRDGTECEGFNNQLDVVDISNLVDPVLIATHPMINPHGLSLFENTIFICEGIHGLRSFDRSNSLTIGDQLLDHVRDFDAFDIIALPNEVAVVIGVDGLYQFDIRDPSDLKQISLLPVNRD